MDKEIYISVSTGSVKSYQAILEYCKQMQNIADMIHCDIMDGQFVPNKTFDASLVSNINQNTNCMLDVHLMVADPLEVIEDYLQAGANIVTVHYEAFSNKEDFVKAIDLIHSHKALAGLAISPSTPFKEIRLYCYSVDVVLVMSVEPGASGQKFIPESFAKIKQVKDFRDQNALNFKIEVDGGINEENVKMVVEAGADMLAMDSCIYKADDRAAMVKKLKSK